MIVKVVDDPFGAVADGTTFSGGWSCQYGGDRSITGTWSITPPDTTFEPPDQILLESECTATENPPDPSELPDVSYAWGTPEIDGPATVVPGGTATVTVTNTVERVFGALEITKTVVDPDGGVLPGAAFPGVWECTQGENTYSGRYTVGPGETTTAFTPEDERVPVLAVCTITEDTPFVLAGPAGRFVRLGRRDLRTRERRPWTRGDRELGVTNTVVRVYSDVTVSKVVTGPAADLVPDRSRVHRHDQLPVRQRMLRSRPPGPRPPRPRRCVPACSWSRCAPRPRTRQVSRQAPSSATRRTCGWSPSSSGPVTVVLPDQPRPEIVVTNPTDRLFGTFDVTKLVTGDTEGIVDPTEPYRMEFECTSQSGEQISGELEVPADGTRAVGPGSRSRPAAPARSPSRSTACPGSSTTRSAGVPRRSPSTASPSTPPAASSRSMIPTPQEDEQEPNVEIVVTNPVRGAAGAGTRDHEGGHVRAGAQRRRHGHARLRRRRLQPGCVPVDYDLTDEFLFADGVVVTEVSVENVQPGDIPVNENFDGDTDQAIASATIAGGASHRYRITVTADVSAVTTARRLDCVVDPGEEGTGFLNRATVNPSAEDCAPIDNSPTCGSPRTSTAPRSPSTHRTTTYTRLTYTIEVTNDGPGDCRPTSSSPTPCRAASCRCRRCRRVGSCTRDGAAPDVSVGRHGGRGDARRSW